MPGAWRSSASCLFLKTPSVSVCSLNTQARLLHTDYTQTFFDLLTSQTDLATEVAELSWRLRQNGCFNVCNQKDLPAALQSAPTHQCDDTKDPLVPQNVPMGAVARAAFKSFSSVL